MPAGKYNIVVEQGAKFSMPVAVFDANDDAYDLTGFTGRGKIRADYDSAAALASFTVTGDWDTKGTFTVELGASTTAGLASGTGVYDIEIVQTADTDNVIRLLQGKVTITPEATK